MELATQNRKTLAVQVYEVVRNAIAQGVFGPGDLLSVTEIAERLNVSRTPAREALLKLEEQGIVKFERNRGARILKTTAADLQELFGLRVLLEIPAAYKAAGVATDKDIATLGAIFDEVANAYRAASSDVREHLEPDVRFHKAIATIAGSKRLANILDNLFDQQMTADGSSLGYTRGIEELIADHRNIYEGIAARAPAAAARAMRDHLLISSAALTRKETGREADGGDFSAMFTDIFTLEERDEI